MSLSEDAPKNIPSRKVIWFQLLSSGSSSLVEVTLMQPLDVIKTRLQLQSRKAAIGKDVYAGVFDAFVKIYQQEGFKAFWRGIFPPLVSDTPRRAIKFLIFEQTKCLFLFQSPHPTPLTYALAGGLAGTIEGIITNPFEVIKVVQQANREKKRNTLKLARKIIENHGYGTHGLFRGISATMLRNCVFHAVWFSFFYSVKEATPMNNDPKLEFMRKFAIGFTSGVLGCIVCCPFDVTKSIMQGTPPSKANTKYSTTFRTISTVFREQGFLGLYNGFIPQILRSGPASGILLLGYEYVNKILLNHFP